MATDTPWLTPNEAAAYVRRHKTTLAKEVQRGRLRAARVGGRGQLLYRREWLDDWLEQQATPVVVVARRHVIGT